MGSQRHRWLVPGRRHGALPVILGVHPCHPCGAHCQDSAIFPVSCPIPKTSYTNSAVVSARALTDTLLHPTYSALFAKPGNSQLCAIKDLAGIFDQAIFRPPLAPLLAPHVLPVAAPPSPRVTLSPSAVPPPSPRVPALPIVRPSLIELDNFDEPDPGPSQPSQSPRLSNNQKCFASTTSLFC